MNVEATMVQYYAQRASEYERIYHKPERQADLQQLRAFVGSAFAGRDVFEVACGTGYWTQLLSERATSVMATDINEEVLRIARSKPVDVRKTNFTKADAYDLPPFPRNFTGGLGVFWWSHVPQEKLRNFLETFHRIFSPGALVVFIDNCYVEGNSTPISRTDKQGNTYQTRKLEDGSSHDVLKNFPDEVELRTAIDGLATDVCVEFLRYYWILSYATVPRA